jgi:YD repeat-containing protein
MAAGVTRETFLSRGSSNISAFTYDPADQTLEVLFRDGRSYIYSDVDPETVGRWQRAGGAGKFFYANIRNSYPYEES